MTSPTVFRPLLLTHLHGDHFFLPLQPCILAAFITLFMVNQVLRASCTLDRVASTLALCLLPRC